MINNRIKGSTDTAKDVDWYLKTKHDGSIVLGCTTSADDDWWVLSITPEGKVHRYGGIAADVGLQVDAVGRIVVIA